MEQEWENPKEDVQTRFAFYTYKDEPEVVYLSNVFVEESSRHQGLGTRILKAAEMVAKTYGATTILLRVRPDSPAKAWYLNHGYIYMTSEGEYQWLEKHLHREINAKFEQAMELADKFEKGYDDGAYDTKTKILRWAMEHKKVIETNGNEDDAFERGEYSILNALIDRLNSM